MLKIHMIGNAHLDPVWLWDWQAGVDEALATFRSVADRCDEYPQFIFTRGEAWLYQQVQRLDPDLFARVRRLVEAGQWHITGGQWIQPDLNLPTEAGLRRQYIHGKRYFKQHFGIEPTVGYNVDSFGHTATLPDLLRQQGMDAYVFARPREEQVSLPAATFRWRGVGGSEVLTYRIPLPYTTRTHDLYGQIMGTADAADPDLGHVMCFYGVGNHGGGPTKQNIEYILEHQHAFDGMELCFSTPERFFDEVREKQDQLPVIGFELQRTFPGCYVVMSEVKRQQHRGEHRLEQAAAVIEMCPLAQGPDTQNETERRLARLDAAWDDLLFTQFHDILAGTSVASAWPSVAAFQGRARLAADELILEATRTWARQELPDVDHQQIVLLNPSPDAFQGLVRHEPFLDFDLWNDRWIADADGNPIPHQLTQPGHAMVSPAVLFPAAVEAKGISTLYVRDDLPPLDASKIDSDLNVSESTLSNRQLKIDVGDRGVCSIQYAGQPILGEAGIGLHLRHDSADTWGFKIDRFDEPIDTRLAGMSWCVEDAGPLRSIIRGEGQLRRSPIRWTLWLDRDEPILHMRIAVVYSEHFRALQMPVQLVDMPGQWRCGLAGAPLTGCPRRSSGRSTVGAEHTAVRRKSVSSAPTSTAHRFAKTTGHGRCSAAPAWHGAVKTWASMLAAMIWLTKANTSSSWTCILRAMTWNGFTMPVFMPPPATWLAP